MKMLQLNNFLNFIRKNLDKGSLGLTKNSGLR